MQRLLIDHLKRKKWYILGFGGCFIGYCFPFLFLVAEDGSRERDPRMLNSMFLTVVVIGSFIPVRDMSR